jgi:hypothetical protein
VPLLPDDSAAWLYSLPVVSIFSTFCSVRKTPGEDPMRIVINTVANVTTNAIVNRRVRTVMAGVDATRAPSSHHLRLYAAPAPQAWSFANGQKLANGLKPFAGKQTPAGTGSTPGSSDLSRCSRRETSRCRRPRVSSCIARS